MFCNARHCRRFQTIAVGFLPTAGRMDFIYCPQAFIVVCFAKASAFSLSNQPQKGYFLRLLRRLGQLIPLPIPRTIFTPSSLPLPCRTATPRDGVFCVYFAPPLTPRPAPFPRRPRAVARSRCRAHLSCGLAVGRDVPIAPPRHRRGARLCIPRALVPRPPPHRPWRLATCAPISFLWSEEIFPDRIKITFYWTPIPVPSIFVPTIFLFLFR